MSDLENNDLPLAAVGRHPGGRILAFDGIRGVAAIYIVWGHLCGKFMVLLPSLTALSWLIRRSNFAVCLFFLISGFLTMLVSEYKIKKLTPKSYLEFIAGRFLRLYPAYLAALLLLVVMVCVARVIRLRVNVPLDVCFPWASLPWEMMMLQNWKPGSVTWNYPAWSISVLWWCNLFLFPPLLFVVRRVTDWRLLALMIVFLTCVYASIHSHSPVDEVGYWIFTISRVIFPFAIGAVLFAIWRIGQVPPRWTANLAATGGIGGFFGAHYLSPGMGFVATGIVITSLILVVLSAGWPNSFIYLLMKKPLFVSLGKASYSVYLSHALAERIAGALMPAHSYAGQGLAIRLAVFTGYLVLLAGGAAGFYFVIERFCERLHRIWARKLSSIRIRPVDGDQVQARACG
ncbi:MAG: acyltransferase 3 [Chthoniobacteraceae bacterium]|nr:acyltransferase 3 [Chthoniobacteraceae bacterium]